MTPPNLGYYLGKVRFLSAGRETNDRAYSIRNPGTYSKIMSSEPYARYCKDLLKIYKDTEYEAVLLTHILGISL